MNKTTPSSHCHPPFKYKPTMGTQTLSNNHVDQTVFLSLLSAASPRLAVVSDSVLLHSQQPYFVSVIPFPPLFGPDSYIVFNSHASSFCIFERDIEPIIPVFLPHHHHPTKNPTPHTSSKNKRTTGSSVLTYIDSAAGYPSLRPF